MKVLKINLKEPAPTESVLEAMRRGAREDIEAARLKGAQAEKALKIGGVIALITALAQAGYMSLAWPSDEASELIGGGLLILTAINTLFWSINSDRVAAIFAALLGLMVAAGPELSDWALVAPIGSAVVAYLLTAIMGALLWIQIEGKLLRPRQEAGEARVRLHSLEYLQGEQDSETVEEAVRLANAHPLLRIYLDRVGALRRPLVKAELEAFREYSRSVHVERLAAEAWEKGAQALSPASSPKG